MKLITKDKAEQIVSFKDFIEATDMKLVEFCDKYGVVYRTAQQWKSDKAAGKCPDWALKLFVADMMECDGANRIIELYNECPDKESLIKMVELFNSDEDFE